MQITNAQYAITRILEKKVKTKKNKQGKYTSVGITLLCCQNGITLRTGRQMD